MEEKTKQKASENKTNSKKTVDKKGEKEKTSAKELRVYGFHSLELATYIFNNVQNPKAVVLIVHGMQEHSARYADFANFLNENGYVAVASDLRGHGQTMKSKADYGCGEEDIFSETVKDQLALLQYISESFPNLPIYLFGHSYGSMLAQNLIQQSALIEKAVICGTADGDSTIFKLASAALSVLKPFKNPDARGGIEEKLCIKAYGKKFQRGNWLTRDEAAFDKYCQDEFCGGTFPFSFYYSMIKNMRKTNKGLSKVGNKKVFFISGGADPLSSGGKTVKKLCKRYLKHNINAKIKIYPDARHELINEINKNEVYDDVLDFFNS